MGTLEESGRTRKRKRNLKLALLAGVKISAVAGVVVLAPNAAQALYKLGLIPKASNDTSLISSTCARLIRQGLLTRTSKGLRLTAKGTSALTLHEMSYSAGKPRRWDGRWRVLIFDVPEYRKGIRDKIRRTLMHIGFVRLQDSVWVYPYDCEDIIVLLKADFKIGKDVLYMIVDELEGDSSLRKEFHLPGRK